MSWNDYYARRDALDAVLRHAERDPSGPLPFAEIDRAAELFGNEERLLLALYYRWTQRLSGYLRAEVAGPEDSDVAPGADEPDYADRVADAWRTTAAENPALRAVLDASIERYPAALIPALEREQRMLAVTAGLAEPYEPGAEVTRIGAAFLALVRHRDAKPARRSSPVGQLLRLLAPSA
ncbi:MAG: hypothetical protein ACRDQ7_23040 [Haloechinothrix sp.]